MAPAETASASAPASRRPQPATARPVKASGSAAIRAVRAVVPRGISPRGVSTCVPTIVSAFPGRYLPDRARAHMVAARGIFRGRGARRVRVRVIRPPGGHARDDRFRPPVAARCATETEEAALSPEQEIHSRRRVLGWTGAVLGLAAGGLVAGAPEAQAAPGPAAASVREALGRKSRKNAVALTIDDGPHPTWTPKVLDLLAEHGVEATFSLVGEQAQAHPKLVRRIARE